MASKAFSLSNTGQIVIPPQFQGILAMAYRYRIQRLKLIVLLFVCSSVGCSSDENTVIQPGASQPTAEEVAEYEDEVESMNEERE